MAEKVQTYLLDDPDTLIPMDRDAFYDEQITLATPTRAVEIVSILIFNEDGELLLQKRARTKRHNPGRIDKSIGGHVTNGDHTEYTVMVETVQELQVPSIVLRNKRDFLKTYDLLGDYLDTIALLQYIDTRFLTFQKTFDGTAHPIANKVHIYLGVYGGRVKTTDREAQGILTYGLEQLEQEMTASPGLFTDDLAVLFTQYRKEIAAFRQLIVESKKD